ncbi:hypothetical protein M0Q97_05495 [Candidatus Dojkabacteria bacterium]|jgi:hypothetical protein|nr:hypothetical protein [Candidatus Dojkabacteria bacterium]
MKYRCTNIDNSLNYRYNFTCQMMNMVISVIDLKCVDKKIKKEYFMKSSYFDFRVN